MHTTRTFVVMTGLVKVSVFCVVFSGLPSTTVPGMVFQQPPSQAWSSKAVIANDVVAEVDRCSSALRTSWGPWRSTSK